MRKDYMIVADKLRQEGWSDEDLAEYAQSFKSAIDSGDDDRINAAAIHLQAEVRARFDTTERINLSLRRDTR